MKIVSLFDSHIPYHIPLEPIYKFIDDFRPDVIVLGGDMSDWEPASHWIANQSTKLDGQSIKRCYTELHSVLLDPLREVMPKGCKVKYLIGNHEDWLNQTAMLNRNGQGYWEMENNIDLKKYNMELIPLNLAYQPCDHLVYIHGIYTNEFHAKKTVQAYHCSVIYGHVHTLQSYTDMSPVNSKHFYKATSVGALTPRNPCYGHNKPNKWTLGFNYCYIDDKTGYFHDTPVIIVNGGFWAMGKFYR